MSVNIGGILINNLKDIKLICNEDDTFQLSFNSKIKDEIGQEYNANFNFPRVGIDWFVANKNDDSEMFNVTISEDDNK